MSQAKSNRRVLVLGAYGMLGHKLIERLQARFEVRGTCRSQRRPDLLARGLPDTQLLLPGVVAEDITTVQNAVELFSPDVLINCIGIIKQQRESKSPRPAIQINALFPHQLAELCQTRNVKLIHFSTDCIFSGKKGNYGLNEPSDAEDLYGRTKYLGEVSGPSCLTIRSSIIGPELGSSYGLLEWFLSQRGKTVKGFRKAVFSGVTTLEMAQIVENILESHPSLDGVWQVASQPISKFDLLSQIKDRLRLDIQIQPDDGFVCDRSLDGSRFYARTNYRIPDWPEMIREMVEDPEIKNRRELK